MLASNPSEAALAKRSTLLFLGLVFGTTWLFQLPYLLAKGGLLGGPPERFMPLVVLGFFGPFLLALLLAAWQSQGHGTFRAMWRGFARWRVHPGYYLLALALPCALFVAMRALVAAVGVRDLGPWFYPPVQPQQIAALLLIPFTEQLPWRGYLYPRLECLYGPHRASVITGLAWGAFHVQKHAFFDPNASLLLALLTLAMMTAGTVVFSWFYLRGGRSMCLVIVAHMGVYLNNPAVAVAQSLLPLALLTIGYSVLAFALLLRPSALVPNDATRASQPYDPICSLSEPQ